MTDEPKRKVQPYIGLALAAPFQKFAYHRAYPSFKLASRLWLNLGWDIDECEPTFVPWWSISSALVMGAGWHSDQLGNHSAAPEPEVMSLGAPNYLS